MIARLLSLLALVGLCVGPVHAEAVFFGGGKHGLGGTGFSRSYGAAPAPFVNDTFTDADTTTLTAHTGETGATWAANGASATAQMVVATNRVYNSVSGTLYASGTPADADYSVEADYYYRATTATGSVAVGGRYSTSALSGYLCGLFQTGNTTAEARLYSISTGTLSSPLGGGAVSQTVTVGVSYRMKLTMSGTTIKCFIDGVEKVTATDATFAAAGKAALRVNTAFTSTTGIHVDNFQAND